MLLFNLILVFYVSLTSIVNASDLVCHREIGDELLLSQGLLQIKLLGGPEIVRSFPGYRITCIESNIPLLDSLLHLEVLNGGIGCDRVALLVRVGRLISIGLGVNVYGVKLSSNATAETQLICEN